MRLILRGRFSNDQNSCEDEGLKGQIVAGRCLCDSIAPSHQLVQLVHHDFDSLEYYGHPDKQSLAQTESFSWRKDMRESVTLQFGSKNSLPGRSNLEMIRRVCIHRVFLRKRRLEHELKEIDKRPTTPTKGAIRDFVPARVVSKQCHSFVNFPFRVGLRRRNISRIGVTPRHHPMVPQLILLATRHVQKDSFFRLPMDIRSIPNHDASPSDPTWIPKPNLLPLNRAGIASKSDLPSWELVRSLRS